MGGDTHEACQPGTPRISSHTGSQIRAVRDRAAHALRCSALPSSPVLPVRVCGYVCAALKETKNECGEISHS